MKLSSKKIIYYLLKLAIYYVSTEKEHFLLSNYCIFYYPVFTIVKLNWILIILLVIFRK